MNGIQCLRSLYLAVHKPELKDPSTSYNEYIMTTGTKVGELARKFFENGILIEQDHADHEAAVKATENAIENSQVDHIFEAAFTFEEIKIRVDILKKNRNGSLQIIEVKSSTKVKEAHLYDVAVQKYVLAKLGFRIDESKLMFINSEYKFNGSEYDLSKLFKFEDLSDEIAKISPNIESSLDQMRATINKDIEPDIEIGSHCKDPNQCNFYSHCRKNFGTDHISKLYRIGDKRLNILRARNISSIKNIPDDIKLTETQVRIRDCLIDNAPFYSPEVKIQLNDLQYPIYFMDFETSNPALPVFPDSSPWEHIPFQWSVHKLARDGTLTHLEYLPVTNKDPRKEFAESLIKALDEQGTVVVYFDAFEKGVISRLSQHLGGILGEKLLEINDRVFDLYKLIYNHVYHPQFQGSFSIKKVLPALVPSLSYEGMNIADGATALIAYQKMRDESTSEVERSKIYSDLIEYCKLDTLAMVEIFKFLLGDDKQLDLEVVKMATTLARSMLKNGNTEQDVIFSLRKRFDEQEIKAALKELRKQSFPLAKTASLRESKTHFGWYEQPNKRPDSQWSALKEHLLTKEKSWTESMVDSLDHASTVVVSHLAPPQSEHPLKVKGLVLGYIQSGKTANFSTTIAKAVDEGYKLIIVLAGMHNNLRKQTESRLRSELVAPLHGKTCTTLTDVDEKGDFIRRQPVSANSQLSRQDGFVLVVLKKNSTVLRNFNHWLDEASADVIKACPTLVIDDESDQASINTNKPDKDASAINSHIRSLIERFHTLSYVGYTATPFANVFIDAKVTEDIYPKDFLVTLEKPVTYYGPEELFGRNEVNGRDSTEGLPVIRIIPEDEADSIRKMATSDPISELPDHLKLAIKHFLLGAGIRLSRGQWKEHITMLVHISHLTDTHSRVFDLIDGYVGQLKYDIEDGKVKSLFHEIWENDFKETTIEIQETCDHEFEKIWRNITKFVASLELIMDNSNSNERLTFDRTLREGAPLWGLSWGEIH